MSRRFETAAVALAERGYFVFPCKERGKEPLTSSGFKEATRDERQILTWWSRWPNANIGVACGASGIAVLDIDSKAGADPDDEVTELDLEAFAIVRTGEAGEPCEKYPASLAGVRGAHVIFAGELPTGVTSRPGVEIRGVGAYIVAAPSVHPSGVEYLGDLPPVAQLPPVPESIAELARRNGHAAPALPDVIDENRNTTLTSLAGTMRRRGMSEDAILAALQAENQARCRPPLEDTEVAKIAASVAKYKPNRAPSDLSDLVVPDWLQSELEQAGVSDEDIEGAGSLKDLMKLLGGKKDSVATEVVRLIEEAGVALFHDPEQRAYATFTIDEHGETWPVRSKPTRLYAQRLYWREHQAAPPAQSLTDALGVLEGKAIFDGRELPVHFRVAGDDREIIIDLGDREWRAVRITRDGWTVLEHPVRFRRTSAMQPLPVPERGGSLDLLRPFVNVADDDGWRLVVGWLLAAMRPGHPYPLLVAHGEQGSAKSTLGRVLRKLVDPNASPLRVAPHDAVDLMVTATNSWVVAYDNLSRVPPSLSDALCRLSTGGGLSKRELYSDGDEFILDAMRPAIINGIDEVVNRSDLLDRAVLVELPVIAEQDRLPEDDFWLRFADVHAQVLGALCDALSGALARVDTIELERLPRMADFAIWVTAAEPALGWEPGSFLESYTKNRGASHEVAVDASAIGPALLTVAEEGFSGSPSELLAELGTKVNEKLTHDRDWPQSARALSAELKRLSPNLRQLGFKVEHWKTSDRAARRMVNVRRVDP